MTKFSFGPPISDDDVLEVQGVQYPMMPVGMRAIRRMLVLQSKVPNRTEGEMISEAEIDLMLDIVVNAVRPEVREKFKEHIEESVTPNMLVQIAAAVMGSFSDLDPTQPESSSDGSSPTGQDSMDGAPAAALTPSN